MHDRTADSKIDFLRCNKEMDMETPKNKIIIWGVDGFNTLGLLRQLGRDDIDLFFLIKGKASFASKSKFCKRFFETPTIEEGYDFLISSFKNEEYKPIIFTSGDDIMVFIDKHKEEFEKYFMIPGCSTKGDTEKYTDKNEMTRLADEIGIVCPKSIKITKNSQIDAIGEITYPCLIKPAHENPGHYNEFKFKICKNEKSLKRTLKYVREDSEFIVQQFIPKKWELLVYGARMWNGKTEIAGAIVRDRMANGGTSHGYITKEIPQCADMTKVRDFLEKIDYHGLFAFEYGLFENDAYFFEVNLRNDGTSHYYYQAGANIPLAYAYSCTGIDYSQISTSVGEKQWFIDEVLDFENVALGKISKKKWKEDLKQATVFKYYDKDDTVPFELAKKQSKKIILENLTVKRFRTLIVFIMDKLGLKK